MSLARTLSFPATLLFVAASCSAPAAEPRLVTGECADVYGAQVCTWAMMMDTAVVEVGATVPVAAISGAPDEAPMTWPPTVSAVIALPTEAMAGTGLQHLTVYWEPHGHPPGPYLYPHFDFHFYNISMERREAIDCASTGKPSTLPAGYDLPDEEIPEIGMLVGLCVPQMGMHALDSAEYHGTAPFSGTMVVGYYDGAPIFVEPMITRELLLQRQSFALKMPVVEAPDGVRYPRRVRADYDPEADAYRMAFWDFPTTVR